LTFSIKGVIRK